MIERSHGKARHTWPRQIDVQPVRADESRTEGRDKRGLFVAGNRASAGQGQKNVLKRGFGPRTGDAKTVQISRDTSTMYTSLLKALPCVDAFVRVTVAGQARAAVMAAHVTQQAVQAGVETAAGQKLLELGAKYEQAALRAGVIALDVSAKLHAAQPRPNPWWSGGSDDDEAVEPEPDATQDDAEPVDPDADSAEPADARTGILDGTTEGDT